VKHVERRHFFVREKVEDGLIEVPYVNTIDNIADFFTKPIQGAAFFRMRDIIMNCDARAAKALRAKAMLNPRCPDRAKAMLDPQWPEAMLSRAKAMLPPHATYQSSVPRPGGRCAATGT